MRPRGTVVEQAYHSGVPQRRNSEIVQPTLTNLLPYDHRGSTDMRSVVARMTSTEGGNFFDGYKEILGPFEQPCTDPNGGDADFGSDGYLGFGDGGGD